MLALRGFFHRIAAASWMVGFVGACGVDSGARAAPANGTVATDGSAAVPTADGSAVTDSDGSAAITGLEASLSAVADAGTPPHPDGALLGSDGTAAGGGGVVDIYIGCAPVALTQHHADPSGFTLDYPVGWTGSVATVNSYALRAPYSYLPTGASTPTTDMASVTTLSGETARDAGGALQRMLEDRVTGLPGATIRRFDIGGGPAIAWWNEQAPAPCGACKGPGDPGPNLIFISVAASHGLDIVVVTGYARIDAPAQTFCDIQAIEASLAFR